jgi:signal transduction histidine kinase
MNAGGQPRPGRRRWGLHSRIAVALATAGVLLLGVVAGAGVLVANSRQAQTKVTKDYYDALRASQSYFIKMLDSETAVRGYALTRDRSNLKPFDDSGAPWNTDLVPLVRARVPQETAAMAVLTRMQAASRAWYQDWAAPAIEQIGSGRPGAGLDAEQIARGTRLFDQVRAEYATYIDTLRAGRHRAADRLHDLTTLLFAATVALALIAVATAGALWMLLRRWVTRPVSELGREAGLVTAGDLNHEVRVAGPPEFQDLGAAVEQMRAGLVEQLAQVEDAQRTVELSRARLEKQAEELQRSNRELEQFAYVASHDLQEPLRKVASFCQLLERRYDDQLDDRGRQYIHFAVDGAQRMQQLINDLLEFSRVGRIASPTTQVDTAAVARRAVANLETAIEEAGAEVRIGDLPTVPGEAGLLSQVFQNVVANAVKFRSDAAPVVQLDARRDGDDWEFRCSDNGIGIPAEYAERVFLIFQRLHPKEVYSGTGIGLSMCRKIVEYHGGRIWVDRTEPTGTTIRWTLPAVGAGPVPVPAGADLEPEPARP